MKAPSRAALLAVVVTGAMLSGTATALAQEDDGNGGLVDVLNGVTYTLNLELLGQCDAQEVPPPAQETPPAADTPPAGETGGEPDSGGVDVGAASAPSAGAGDVSGGVSDEVTVSDSADEDNGVAPVGGMETGAGGTANGTDAGMAAALAGAGIVTAAGGVLLARRNLRRRSGRTL